MSNILKKAVIVYSGGGMACGPVGGSNVGELTVESNGKTIYITGSDIWEAAVYYVAEHSMIDAVLDNEDMSFDEMADEAGVLFYGETGPVDDFEGEEKMALSEYYGCIKYLRSIIRDTDSTDPIEVTVDYGKDLDLMDLPSLASYEDDDDEFETMDPLEGIDISDKFALFRRRLKVESFRAQPSVMDEMGGEIDWDGDIARITVAGIDEKEYQAWKKHFLDIKYAQEKEKNFKTCSYLFAGIGQYEVTVPEDQVDCIKNWVNANGSGFFGSVKDATEEEVKYAIGKNCESDFMAGDDD